MQTERFWCSRPQLSILDLAEAIPALKEKIDEIGTRKEEIVEATEVLLKYEGYIERERLIAESSRDWSI